MLSKGLVSFSQEKEADPFCDDDPDEHGTVIGAARLGDKAAIGNGLWTTAHGGAVSCFSLLQSEIRQSLLEQLSSAEYFDWILLLEHPA